MGRWPADWPQSVHMIGVGGVAMSSLAVVLQSRGVVVRGSDHAIHPPASEMLADAGVAVRTPYDAANLDPPSELVVVGNAISPGNPELDRAVAMGAALASLPEVVERLLTPGRRVTVVAGTHGKTTTASVVAYLHFVAGRDPSFLIGGRPGWFPSGGRLGGGHDLVLEGDEYDSAYFDKGPKFLHYWPDIAVLGPVEFDHADIYADLDAVERAFSWFVRLPPAHGVLVVHAEDQAAARLAAAARCRVVRVGLGGGMDLRATRRLDDDSGQQFVIEKDGRDIGPARFALAGAHNARNALAALAAVEAAGVPLADAVAALSGFAPPRRRLELVARRDDIEIYDDFAHHPTAIAETLATLRGRVRGGGRLIACLEPRSNTMVRSLVQQRLIESLSAADIVWLAPVDRPERFAPGEQLDVAAVAAALSRTGVAADAPLAPAQMADRLAREARPGDRIVLMSNGAFGGLAAALARAFGPAGARS